MNIGDAMYCGLLGFVIGYGLALLVQWWAEKVGASFRREVEDCMKQSPQRTQGASK